MLPIQVPQAPVYAEELRPQFHFTAKSNWLNDPNGLVYYGGTYHLFFQHNPLGIDWGNMTWGHATSPDLVHWSQQADAIERDSMGTIFSGSAVVDWNNTSGFQSGHEKPIVAIYACAGDTSPESKGKPYTQCLAYSSDAGKSWTKYAQNPVISQIAPGNRDPKVLWYQAEKRWIMALFLEGNDFALLSSPDLKHWTQIQRLKFDGAAECPDFFEMPVARSSEKKWIFTSASGQYLVGSFDGLQFHPEQKGRKMDLGTNYYAVQTYSDIPPKDGRRIQIAWMNGGKYPEMPFNQQMSFPCALTLYKTSDGFLIFRTPVQEIRKLYSKTTQRRDVSLGPGDNALAGLKGDLYDIEMEIQPKKAAKIELTIRGWKATIDVSAQTIQWADRMASLPIRNGLFDLRLLIDRTSIEFFANGGELSSTNCFLPDAGPPTYSLTAVGGELKVQSIMTHTLKSAWNHAPK